MRSLFKHYVLKTLKTHFFETLVKNICGPPLKLQHLSDNVCPSSGSLNRVLDWNCRFRCCLSVVSVVLVVGFDSFGRVWHLSCVLFRLVSVLLMLFSGVLKGDCDCVCSYVKCEKT
jgi:hypothetical protein